MDDPGDPGTRGLELGQGDVVRSRIGHAGEYRTHPRGERHDCNVAGLPAIPDVR